MRATDSSTGVTDVSMTTSARSGGSYGSLTPVKCGISPARALAYSPLTSRCSATSSGVETWTSRNRPCLSTSARASSRACSYGAIAATTTVPPCLTTSPATNPIRRMLRSRCSRENVSSLERWVRTTSPSSTVTGRPSASSEATSASAIVDLPAPERPVRNTVTPGGGGADMVASVPQRRCGPAPWSAAAHPSGRRGSSVRRDASGAPGILDRDQVQHVLRQPAGDDVGEADLLEHPAVGRAGGDPHGGQRLGGARVVEVLGPLAAYVGEEALLDPHHAGEA